MQDAEGNTAVLLAAKGSWSVLEYLIKWGCNIEHKNKEGKSINDLGKLSGRFFLISLDFPYFLVGHNA